MRPHPFPVAGIEHEGLLEQNVEGNALVQPLDRQILCARLAEMIKGPERDGIALEHAEKGSDAGLAAVEQSLVDRVAYAVNGMSLRVPWRSDCLVRAIAARRWLAAGGVDSRIAIGARHDEDGAFMAHAWLMVGERLVTGGDVSPYGEFVRSPRD